MRTQQITINNKIINVNEKRVSELKNLFTTVAGEADTVMKANSTSDLANVANDLLGSKLITIFPELTQDDIDNAYPSELEDLVGAFINVNFSGIRKVAAPFTGMILKGLQAK